MNKKPTSTQKLLAYKNTKRLLIFTIVSFVLSNAVAIASVMISLSNISTSEIAKNNLGTAQALAWIARALQLLFFIALTLLLIRIVQFNREQN